MRRCSSCRNLWGEHHSELDGKQWDDAYLDDAFVHALRSRRERQAIAIVDVLTRFNAPGPVLDYGCGQGVLLAHLVGAGIDAWGCDIDEDVPLDAGMADRKIHIDAPWVVPPGAWKTVIMLDVLEHHPDPVGYLRRLPGDSLLLKVPTASGPAALAARILARFAQPQQIEQLFLTGESMRHHWLGTRRGVETVARLAGWTQRWRGSIVEVGTELPDRLRPRPFNSGVRFAAQAMGAATSVLGPVWSDTEVQYFVRRR